MKKLNQHAIKVMFHLEVDEGAYPPSTPQFLSGLGQALPKEWWTDYREDDWGVISITPLNDLGEVVTMPADEARIRMLGAEAEAAGLSNENAALNDRISGLLEDIATVGNERDNQMTEWLLIRKERDAFKNQVANLMDKNDSQRMNINTLLAARELNEQAEVSWKKIARDAEKREGKLKMELLNANRESQLMASMVGQIVDAMEGAGFEIAGWGNDDQLVQLEDIKGELGSACADLEVALDEIRTQR